MQQLAPRPSQPPRPIPYGLMSLWDIMFNFSPSLVHDMLNIFASHERTARENALLAHRTGSAGHPLAWASNSAKAEVEGVLSMLAIATNQLDSSQIREMIRDLGEAVKYSILWSDFGAKVGTIVRAIEHELREHKFYHYPIDRAALVQRVDSDWAATLTAFPAAEKDIRAAVDCYALRHDHASIYHCMMILERGLPALADRVGVKFKKDRPTWRDMISDIRNKIDERRNVVGSPPKGRPPPTKRSAKNEILLLEASGEAAVEFKFFEHAWRNHIAHGRADYDENDAKKVLEHVRTFMEVIATNLKLKEKT